MCYRETSQAGSGAGITVRPQRSLEIQPAGECAEFPEPVAEFPGISHATYLYRGSRCRAESERIVCMCVCVYESEKERETEKLRLRNEKGGRCTLTYLPLSPNA